MPKVTVIIPLYNKGLHIVRTLNSVLKQTFQDFEIIVVDDGSTDNGVEMVNSFNDPRIWLIRQKNQGVSAARNRGVNEATTDLIAFLDADDEWMPLHLETILRLKKKYPEAGIYTTAYKIYLSNGKTRWPIYKYIPDSPWEGVLPNYFKSSAIGEPPVCSSVVMIPKKIFLELGGFPQGYQFQEDADLFGKIALKYPVAFSWELGAIYHWDATNRTCNKKYSMYYELPFIKIARIAIVSGEVLPEFIEPLNEYIYKVEIWQAIEYVLAGNGTTARAILRECNTKWNYKMKLKWLVLAMLPYSIILFLQKLKKILFFI